MEQEPLALTRTPRQGSTSYVQKRLLLPNEILMIIFLFLQLDLDDAYGDNDIRRSTLLCLTRASKHFQQLALPILYRTIPEIPLKLFDIFLRKADRAMLVRAIQPKFIQYEETQSRRIDITSNLPSDVVVGTYYAVCEAFSLPGPLFHSRMANALKSAGSAGFSTMSMALLVHLLPNLETIGFPKIRTESWAINYFLGATFSPPRILRLREVRLDCLHPSQLALTDPLYPMIHAAESLQASFLYRTSKRPPFGGLPQLQLRHIKLMEFKAGDMILLDGLLSCCPNLRTLHIEKWLSQSTRKANIIKLGSSLQNRVPRLESLTVTIVDDGWHWGGSGWQDRRGSLRELTSLKILKLPPGLLTRYGDGTVLGDILPESLDHLILSDKNISVWALDVSEAQICSLMRDNGQFTKLRQIELRGKKRFQSDAAALGWSVYHKKDQDVRGVQGVHTVVLTKMVSYR